MKLQFDTLKYAKILLSKGFAAMQAQALAEQMAGVEFNNLYSNKEVDNMLSESVEKTFRTLDQQFDKRLQEQRQNQEHRDEILGKQFDKRLQEQRQEWQSQLAELRSGRRWIVGTIITCALALAGYLSALIHLTH